MAFVPGYQRDIFISYAKLDDHHEWVTSLVRELKTQLAAWLGRPDSCDVWWDRRDLDEAGSIDEQIGTTLQQTAILVAVLSPAYMASKWCKDERRLFLEAVRGKPISDKRTYLVDLGRLDVRDRPEEFFAYLGFDFWKEDEIGRRRTLGFPTPDPTKHDDFYIKVDDLAKKISDRLKELKGIQGRSIEGDDAAQATEPHGKRSATPPGRRNVVARCFWPKFPRTWNGNAMMSCAIWISIISWCFLTIRIRPT